MERVNRYIEMHRAYTPSRGRSKYLRQFPWLCNFVLDSAALSEIIPKNHPLTKFSETAQEYVRLIFTDYDQDIIKLRFFLAIDTAEINPNVIASSNKNKDIEPNRKTDKGLFHLILVLRLLDIAMFHEANGARGGANAVKIPKQLTLKNTTDLMFYEKLYDIRSLLLNASDILSPSFLENSTKTPDETCISLLRQLADTEANNNVGKIVQNFLFASLNLSWLYTPEGASAANVAWGDGLKLPAEPSKLLSQYRHSISPNEIASIETVFRRSSKTGTQTPLYASVMISPLMLLLPLRLPALKLSKKKLMESLKQLGNDRPKPIVEIETLIWSTIMKISLGVISCTDALKDLLDSLPRSHICAITADCTIRMWFKPDPTTAATNSITASPSNDTTASSPPTRSQCARDNEETDHTDGANQTAAHSNYKNASIAPTTDNNSRNVKNTKHIIFSSTPITASTQPRTTKKPRYSSLHHRLTESNLRIIPENGNHSSAQYQQPITDRLTLALVRPPLMLESSNPLVVFNPDGKRFEISARVQNQEILDTLMELSHSIQEKYVDGMPLFITNPTQSIFKIMTETEYRVKPIPDIQEILRTKHIVVKKQPITDCKFNEEGLRTLRPLSEPVTIHDQSIAFGETESGKKEGTLRQILDASREPESKILNAHSVPLVGAGYEANSFSLDHAAWIQTLSAPFSKDMIAAPVLRWGSCATAGAFNNCLTEYDSLGSIIDPRNGSNVWICRANPTDSVSKIGSLVHNDAECTTGAFEAIVLEPGTRLIMRPNTPHAVYTPTDAITHGGHYIASTTMKDTISGMVHKLMTCRSGIEASYKQSLHIFQRIIIFYHMALVRNMIELDDPAREHIPTLANMESIMDVVTVCAMGIFINILNPDTYRHPITKNNISDEDQQLFQRNNFNGISNRDRMASTYVRGLSQSLLDWLNKTLIFRTKDGKVDFIDLTNTVLLDLCITLRTYKMEVQGWIMPLLKSELEGLFDNDTIMRSRLTDDFGKPKVGAMDLDVTEYTVERREITLPLQYDFSVQSMMRLGLNPSDRLYYSNIYGDIDTMMKAINQINKSEH